MEASFFHASAQKITRCSPFLLSLHAQITRKPLGHKILNAIEKDFLKVLSSEMDPAEIRLIRWVFLKGIVALGF
jgi:hypothetical protein